MKMLNWWRLYGLVLALLLSGAATAQEPPRPPWLQPDVVKASIDIGMDDEQGKLFRASVGRFLDGRMKALNRLLNGNNVTNIERKMKSKTNSLRKKMDGEMAEFLTEEQMPKYEIYRDLLLSKMRG